MRGLLPTVDGMTLLAAYHTVYNVVGVAVLLPATQWFTRVVERLLPSTQTALQRALDPSALSSPVIAIESARRVVAEVLARTGASVSAALASGANPPAESVAEAAAALEEVRTFLSELGAPPESDAERLRLTSTLHALDHASRLVELAAERGLPLRAAPGSEESGSAAVSLRSMAAAQAIGAAIVGESALSEQASPIGWRVSPEVAAALDEMERAADELRALQRSHRTASLAAVASGELTAADAFARVEAAGRLDRVAQQAWLVAAYLFGRGPHDAPVA